MDPWRRYCCYQTGCANQSCVTALNHHNRYKRVVALGALGAAGAAAAYYWWNSKPVAQSLTSEEPLALHSKGLGNCSEIVTSTSSSKEATLNVNDFDFHLQQHYESVQEITATQTIPNWLHRVRLCMYQATELEGITQQLRQLQGEPEEVARERKLLLWQQLAQASLTRAASTCWLIPLLDLYLRVKLNMLGRHLYLESTLESLLPSQQWAQRFPNSTRHSFPSDALPKLSSLAQEAFMNHSNFFPDGGAEALIATVSQAVQKVLGSFDMQQPVLPGDVADMLSSIHTIFEQQTTDLQWDAVLMGSEQQRPAVFRADDGTECLLPLGEARIIEEMGREVRLVLRERKFAEALSAAVRNMSQLLVQIVSAKFPNGGRVGPVRSTSLNLGSPPHPTTMRNIRSLQDMHDANGLGHPGSPQRKLPEVAASQMPFARVIGLLATACGTVFLPDGQCSKRIATLPAVQALCASVYTCGPRMLLL